jgi:hypothetical protein
VPASLVHPLPFSLRSADYLLYWWNRNFSLAIKFAVDA